MKSKDETMLGTLPLWPAFALFGAGLAILGLALLESYRMDRRIERIGRPTPGE